MITSLAKHWCFTLNNYKQDDEDRIRAAFESGRILYVVFGKEVSASGTPHLQGVVSFRIRKRLTGCVACLGQAHFEVCRDLSRSITYCKKDGLVTEYGTSPMVLSRPGKRNDLEEFKTAVSNGVYSLKELRETHANVCAKYPRFVLAYVRDHKPLPALPSYPLHDWQSRLVVKLSTQPDPRTITFVVDQEGCKGKSYFCSYLERERDDVQVMKCGKRDDMAFELFDNPRIVLIDVARSASEFLQYQFLEDLKDGRVFSPKYESHTKRFDTPHVIVMMNQEPDMLKLSIDRYDVMYI